MHRPRFRLRTLMIAVVIVSMALASFVALFRPIDGILQAQGRPVRTRVAVAAAFGVVVIAAYSSICALAVMIVRRAIVLRSLLRKSPTEPRP